MGEVVQDTELPSDMFAPSKWNDHKKAKLHYMTCGFDIISQEAANVLLEFDLGQTQIFPVRLWHPDKKTRYHEDFYILNVVKEKMLSYPSNHPSLIVLMMV